MNPSNVSCPAVATYETTFIQPNNPTLDHTVCLGGYQTGAAGANISRVLGACCNSTVVVVQDSALYNSDHPDNGHCWYFCNVTRRDSNDKSPYDFYKMQQCVLRAEENYNYETNRQGKYNIQCIPKRDSAAVSLSLRPVSTAGFALVAVVMGAMILP
jgi:hypothetical protein